MLLCFRAYASNLRSFDLITRRLKVGIVGLANGNLQLTATRSSKENNSVKDNGLLSELGDKWDVMKNKSSLVLFGGGAILTIWISLVVVRSVDSVPLLSGLLELVGLSYSGWLVYRYLLFQENRKELAEVIDDIKRRIIGDDE